MAESESETPAPPHNPPSHHKPATSREVAAAGKARLRRQSPAVLAAQAVPERGEQAAELGERPVRKAQAPRELGQLDREPVAFAVADPRGHCADLALDLQALAFEHEGVCVAVGQDTFDPCAAL